MNSSPMSSSITASKPDNLSFNPSKLTITESDSTALSVTNPLWTSKTNPTKNHASLLYPIRPLFGGKPIPPFGGHHGRQWAQLYCTMITPGKKRRIYDQKFKEAALEMYVHGNRSAPAVARELGICRRSLNLWVKKMSPSTKPIPQSPAQVQRDLRSADRKSVV